MNSLNVSPNPAGALAPGLVLTGLQEARRPAARPVPRPRRPGPTSLPALLCQTRQASRREDVVWLALAGAGLGLLILTL